MINEWACPSLNDVRIDWVGSLHLHWESILDHWTSSCTKRVDGCWVILMILQPSGRQQDPKDGLFCMPPVSDEGSFHMFEGPQEWGHQTEVTQPWSLGMHSLVHLRWVAAQEDLQYKQWGACNSFGCFHKDQQDWSHLLLQPSRMQLPHLMTNGKHELEGLFENLREYWNQVRRWMQYNVMHAMSLASKSLIECSQWWERWDASQGLLSDMTGVLSDARMIGIIVDPMGSCACYATNFGSFALWHTVLAVTHLNCRHIGLCKELAILTFLTTPDLLGTVCHVLCEHWVGEQIFHNL